MTSSAHRTFRWLEQVAADRELPHVAARLAIVLSQFFNNQTGEAWPTQQTLATRLGITDRAVRNSLDALHSQGHLHVTRGVGRKNPNRYRARLSDGKADLFDETSAEDDSAIPALNDHAGDFEEWWKQYPRHVAKAAARREYVKAVESGVTPADLLNGAMRYAAERGDEDPKYTKHPGNWLRGECWRDEATPTTPAATGTAPQNRQRRPSHLETALAGMRRQGDE